MAFLSLGAAFCQRGGTALAFLPHSAMQMLRVPFQHRRAALASFRKVPALHMQIPSQKLWQPMTNYRNNGLFA